MDAEGQESFREFVDNRSAALLRTAVLLSGGDRHAAEDLLQNALVKAAGRWHRIDDPEAYVRQILYRQQVSRWRLKWPRRELAVAEPPESAVGDTAGAAELRIVMRAALARLTTRQRTVLVLLPQALDFARAGGTPPSRTCRRRMSPGCSAARSAPCAARRTARSPSCAASRRNWRRSTVLTPAPAGRRPPTTRPCRPCRPWR